MWRRLALIGHVYGQLTVIANIPTATGQRRKVLCRCTCGTTKAIDPASLRRGATISCGCVMRTIASVTRRIHGRSRTPLYYVWKSMKNRCDNPTVRVFPNYGGRGIQVCDRWRDSFVNFLADMGERPSPQHWIERIDNNGHYAPDNCRWATPTEQGRNRRDNRTLSHDGETRTLTDWARHVGLRRETIANRLRWGWDVADALTTPARPLRSQTV